MVAEAPPDPVRIADPGAGDGPRWPGAGLRAEHHLPAGAEDVRPVQAATGPGVRDVGLDAAENRTRDGHVDAHAPRRLPDVLDRSGALRRRQCLVNAADHLGGGLRLEPGADAGPGGGNLAGRGRSHHYRGRAHHGRPSREPADPGAPVPAVPLTGAGGQSDRYLDLVGEPLHAVTYELIKFPAHDLSSISSISLLSHGPASSRIRRSPREAAALTGPWEQPSTLAASASDSCSQYRSTMTARCCGGSSCRTCISASRRSTAAVRSGVAALWPTPIKGSLRRQVCCRRQRSAARLYSVRRR